MAFAKHILVPTDFSEAASLAVETAATLAREFGAKLTLVHVHDPELLRPPSAVGWSAAQAQRLEQEIERTIRESFEGVQREQLQGVEVVETAIVRDASAARGIVEYAAKIGADLIVIATHGRTGLKHLMIGSVAERVVRHAPCPVLTLRSPTTD